MKKKVIALVVVLALLFALGFRVAHPKDGLASALGSAKSSLIVYKHGSQFKTGQKVVVHVAGQGIETGIVKSYTDKTVDVDTRAAFVRVDQDKVMGSLIIVVPFFGSILNAIGL
jgi:hypothetical protein